MTCSLRSHLTLNLTWIFLSIFPPNQVSVKMEKFVHLLHHFDYLQELEKVISLTAKKSINYIYQSAIPTILLYFTSTPTAVSSRHYNYSHAPPGQCDWHRCDCSCRITAQGKGLAEMM